MKKTILTVATFCMLLTTGINANETVLNVDRSVSTLPAEINSFCKAIVQGDLETVEKLIELGEDVNQKSLGMAPVHFAARYNQAEILRMLIDHGANYRRRSDQGYTAKKYAEMANATEALAVLESAMKK